MGARISEARDPRLALAAATIALIAAGCGSAVLGRARIAGPRAVAAHLGDARDFSAATYLDVPASVAWNATYTAVAERVSIASATYASRTIESRWIYAEPAVEPGVATQRRVRHLVSFRGTSIADYAVDVRTEVEERRREQCAEASAWAPVAGAPVNATAEPELVRATTAALDAARALSASDLTFVGTRDEVLADVSAVVGPRWGFAPADRIEFPLESGARTTTSEDATQNVTVEVSSSLTVDAEVRPDGIGLSVAGRLRWRAESGDEGTRWFDGDGNAVAGDFYARLAERRPPVTVRIADATPLEGSSPAPVELTLASPPPRLTGPYVFSPRLVIVSRLGPDGFEWDAGPQILSALVEWAPTAYRVVRAAHGDAQAATELARQFLLNHGRSDSTLDETARWLAGEIGHASAPDLSFAVRLPGLAGVLGGSFTGADNAHAATWDSAAVDIDLVEGRTVALPWEVVDRDPIESDTVATGAFAVEELAAACAPVCITVGGTMVCVELRPAPR